MTPVVSSVCCSYRLNDCYLHVTVLYQFFWTTRISRQCAVPIAEWHLFHAPAVFAEWLLIHVTVLHLLYLLNDPSFTSLCYTYCIWWMTPHSRHCATPTVFAEWLLIHVTVLHLLNLLNDSSLTSLCHTYCICWMTPHSRHCATPTVFAEWLLIHVTVLHLLNLLNDSSFYVVLLYLFAERRLLLRNYVVPIHWMTPHFASLVAEITPANASRRFTYRYLTLEPTSWRWWEA
jgi:hypothetical protein